METLHSESATGHPVAGSRHVALEEGRMKRTLSVAAAAVLVASMATVASARMTVRIRPRAGRAENYGSRLVCGEGSPLCAEANDSLGYKGE